MLQDIRKSTQGTAAKIIIGLIVISFSLFGIQSILVGGGGSTVGEINGEEIDPVEVQQLVNMQKQRISAMLGANLDPAMLDDQRLSSQALQGIIKRTLLTQAATAMELAVSEQQIGSMVGNMAQFQQDGKFSPELYSRVLANAGFTPASFKKDLRQNLLVTQLLSGFAGSEFATPAELALNAKVSGEMRDVRYLTIPLENFVSNADIADSEITQYYNDNQALFFSQESIELDYIELSLDDVAEPVSETDLQQEYELEKNSYQYQTERRVSHIMFEPSSGESDDSVQARLDSVLAELAAGSDFAEVARNYSDDAGSASNGGDLGFTTGDTFPAEMEEVIGLLELGAVSDPVTIDGATHIIKLMSQREGEMASLDELRPELERRIQDRVARIALLRVVESLKDLVFNADDLSAPAAELELTVEHSEAVTRSHSQGLFSNASLLTAAFSEDVLEGGHNSDVIELGANNFVVLRVRKHHPSAVKPLKTVRNDIITRITDESSRAAVGVAAQAALHTLRAGGGVEAYANANGYQWQVELAADRSNLVIPSVILSRVFELPSLAPDQTLFDYVLSPEGDAQVFELARVTPGEFQVLNEDEKGKLLLEARGEHENLVDIEYQRSLRNQADITIL
ncbi:MAG: peptidylprolyl isomerase [Halieaceae bacterium]|jgi:peptidyl-prolyl cis-trans isomerase D|nr:peptidylprolyl isomerase [Halieaceae bacterium]